MRHLFIVLLPPGTRDAAFEAEKVLMPFIHERSCLETPEGEPGKEDQDDDQPDGLPSCGHFLISARTFDSLFPHQKTDMSQFLWLDRYGELPADYLYLSPSDAARRAGDIEVRNSLDWPMAVVIPNREIFWLGEYPDGDITWRRLAEYENLLAQNPDFIAMPMSVKF
jgi:hypothetical protein